MSRQTARFARAPANAYKTMRSRGRAAQSVGLILGEHSLVGIGIQASGDSFEVVSAHALPLPQGAMDGASIVEPSAVSSALRELRKPLRAELRSASVALPAPAYTMRAIRLPDVPAREQRTLVRGELEGAGAIAPGGGGLDFIWSPLPSAEGKKLADVFAYFSDDITLDTVHQAARSAAVTVETIEPASLAMMRGWLAIRGASEPVALLCPSERHSDLLLHDGTRVRHVRRIPAGIADLEAVRHGEAVTPREEERLHAARQPTGGIGTAVAAPFVDDEEEQTREPETGVVGALQASGGLGFLAAEINRTVAFHAREHGEDVAPRRLAILAPTGDAMALAGYLASSLTVPIDSEDPLPAVNLSAAGMGARADYVLAALGAAVGAAGLDYGIPTVNVAQQEQVAEVRRRAPTLLLAGMAGSTLWMIGAAVAAIALSILESNANSHLNSVNAEIERIKQEQAPGLKYQALQTAVDSIRRTTQVSAGEVLGRVAGSLTPGVALKSVNVSADGKVSIEGTAVGSGAVQQFAYLLGSGRVILPASVYIESVRREPAGGLSFRISGSTGKAKAPSSGGGGNI